MTADQIDHWFKYHAPNDEQLKAYHLLREAGRDLAHCINTLCPDCADKTAAIRKVREAIMTANAAIACGGQ